MRVLLLLLFLFACAHDSDSPSLHGKPMDEFYQGSGIEKFFMADLPTWINFSGHGKCRRENQIRYLDYYKLNASYGFSYEVITQMQLMLNRRYQSYLHTAKLSGLKPKDEAFLFHTVMDQVEGGAREIMIPKQKEINLIWIDGFLRNADGIKRFKKFDKTAAAHSAIPVWVSVCYNEKELADFAKTHKLELPVGRVISVESFTPFNSDFQLSHEFSLDFAKIFKDANLKVYYMDEKLPDIFKGIHKTQRVE